MAKSNNPNFATGDRVVSFSGWQDYAVSDGTRLNKLPENMAHPSWALGVLSMPGFTAWAGLREMGRPIAGETLVVGGATGPVNSTVGQIAKLQGLRAVGVAGEPEKCRYAVETLSFDACVDYKGPSFAEVSRAKPLTASTSISRMSAAQCSTQCCRGSTPGRASRSAG